MDRAAFSTVENTYLSIFAVLGALGLLLGSAGLGVIVLRNVLDRRSEWPSIRTRALAFVRDERSWPVSVARYEQVYASALSRTRGGASAPIMSGSA